MKKIRKESGQALVEFALILPILLLMLGPVIDLGRTIYTKTLLQNMSGDLLHMTILENEYSYQGGSYKAIEDKIIQEDRGMPTEYIPDDEKSGYLTKKIFEKYVDNGALEPSQLDHNNLSRYVSIGPTQSGFNHTGHYPKLLKRVRSVGDSYEYSQAGYDKNGKHMQGYNAFGYDVYGYDENGQHKDGYGPGGYDRNGYDKYGYNYRGYDINGLDRNGLNASGIDVNGYSTDRPDTHGNRSKRWELDGMETYENATYFKEVSVMIPYEMKNITFMGKLIFGDSRNLEEKAMGIIYMGGDGRDVTDPTS